MQVPFNQLVQEEVLISRDSSCDQDDSDSAPQQHVFAKARAEVSHNSTRHHAPNWLPD